MVAFVVANKDCDAVIAVETTKDGSKIDSLDASQSLGSSHDPLTSDQGAPIMKELSNWSENDSEAAELQDRIIAELTPVGGWNNQDGLRLMQKPALESLVRRDMNVLEEQGKWAMGVDQILFVEDPCADISSQDSLDKEGIKRKVGLDTDSLQKNKTGLKIVEFAASTEDISAPPDSARIDSAKVSAIGMTPTSRAVEVGDEGEQSEPEEISDSDIEQLDEKPRPLGYLAEKTGSNTDEAVSKPTNLLQEVEKNLSYGQSADSVGEELASKPAQYWLTYLAELWQLLLGSFFSDEDGSPPPGWTDLDFFKDLRGDSARAVRMLTHVNRETSRVGMPLWKPLLNQFEANATIGNLAKLIVENSAPACLEKSYVDSSISVDDLVLEQAADDRVEVCINGVSGDFHYNVAPTKMSDLDEVSILLTRMAAERDPSMSAMDLSQGELKRYRRVVKSYVKDILKHKGSEGLSYVARQTDEPNKGRILACSISMEVAHGKSGDKKTDKNLSLKRVGEGLALFSMESGVFSKLGREIIRKVIPGAIKCGVPKSEDSSELYRNMVLRWMEWHRRRFSQAECMYMAFSGALEVGGGKSLAGAGRLCEAAALQAATAKGFRTAFKLCSTDVEKFIASQELGFKKRIAQSTWDFRNEHGERPQICQEQGKPVNTLRGACRFVPKRKNNADAKALPFEHEIALYEKILLPVSRKQECPLTDVANLAVEFTPISPENTIDISIPAELDHRNYQMQLVKMSQDYVFNILRKPIEQTEALHPHACDIYNMLMMCFKRAYRNFEVPVSSFLKREFKHFFAGVGCAIVVLAPGMMKSGENMSEEVLNDGSDKVVAGGAFLYIHPEKEGTPGRDAELMLLGVRPGYRGHGISKLLLRAVDEMCGHGDANTNTLNRDSDVKAMIMQSNDGHSSPTGKLSSIVSSLEVEMCAGDVANDEILFSPALRGSKKGAELTTELVLAGLHDDPNDEDTMLIPSIVVTKSKPQPFQRLLSFKSCHDNEETDELLDQLSEEEFESAEGSPERFDSVEGSPEGEDASGSESLGGEEVTEGEEVFEDETEQGVVERTDCSNEGKAEIRKPVIIREDTASGLIDAEGCVISREPTDQAMEAPLDTASFITVNSPGPSSRGVSSEGFATPGGGSPDSTYTARNAFYTPGSIGTPGAAFYTPCAPDTERVEKK